MATLTELANKAASPPEIVQIREAECTQTSDARAQNETTKNLGRDHQAYALETYHT